MEGSSESPWPKSTSSSRDLNSSGVSERGHLRLSDYLVFRKESGKLVLASSDRVTDQVGVSGVCEDELASDHPFGRSVEWDDVSLRQWLDKPDRSINAFECLHVFRHIVDIVNVSHMQGIVAHNVEIKDSSSLLPLDRQQQRRSRMTSDDCRTALAAANAQSEASCLQQRLSRGYVGNEQVEEREQSFPMKQVLRMETSWYTSPEEISGGPSSCVSDIYQLGVLLFELFCPLSSREEKCRTMSSLRHRVLLPQLLLKWPMEASFCLWLLHPEPNSRPKMSELLQNEYLSKPRDGFEEREAAIKLRDKTEEEQLALEFFSLIQQRKQEAADKLQDTVSFLNVDIEEVAKQRIILKQKGCSLQNRGRTTNQCQITSQLVWDIARRQAVVELKEHKRCAWSVGYSSADPTLLACGSNDGSVKGVSVATIRTKANVCCVHFPLDTSHSLAFGSADHRIYYYDLCNSKVPLCTLVGHNKTVSYVKFLDNMNLVSSSTDNTVKLWDLSTCTSRVIDTRLQSFTGHTNVKNFMGLSVSDGYIATGSETNEVFIYHKAFPMPVLLFKFDSMDPLIGHESDDAAQFISSVCWRGQSSTLVAANSSGNIKVLEMV